MADIPHLKAPFQIIGGQAAVVEQDSDEDTLACVETILRTDQGDRIENPDLGTPDLAFHTNPVNLEREIRQAITRSEPRAETIPEAEITDLIATVQVGVNLA